MLLVPSCAGHAEVGPVVEVNPLDASLNLNGRMALLTDPGGAMTAEEVATAPSDRFRIPGAYENVWFTSAAQWRVVTLVNDTATAQQRLIEVQRPYLNFVDFYVADGHHGFLHELGGDRRHELGGDRRPYDARPIPYRSFVFPVSIPAGETRLVLLRVQSGSALAIEVTLWCQDAFTQHAIHETMFQAGLHGMALIIILFTALAAFVSRSRAIVWMLVHMALYELRVLMADGTLHALLLPSYPLVADSIGVFAVGAAAASAFMFINTALDLRQWLPRTSRAYRLAALLCVTLTAPGLVGWYRLTAGPLNGLIVLMSVVSFALIGMSLRRRNPWARVLLLGMLIPITSNLLRMARVLGVPTPKGMVEWTFQLGFVFYAVMLALWAIRWYISVEAEKKELAQRQLSAADARLATLVNDAPCVLIQSDLTPDGTWLKYYVSDNVERMIGRTSAQMLADRAWDSLMDPTGRRDCAAAVDDAIRTGQGEYECWISHANGNGMWLRATVRATPGEGGNWRVTSNLLDVTALHKAQEQLGALLRLGPGMLYRVSIGPAGDRLSSVSFNSEFFTRMGYTPEQIATPSFFWSRMQTADLPHEAAAVTECMLNGHGTAEYRFPAADGTIRWLRDEMQDAGREGGRHIIVGYLTDITAERALNQELEVTRRDLEEAVASGPGCLYRLTLFPDATKRLDYVSGGIELMSGYTKAEVYAAGWIESIIDPAFTQTLLDGYEAVRRLGRMEIEYRVKAKSGAWIWVSNTLRGHQMPDGNVRAVGYTTDITQLKERAAQLQHSARMALLGEMAASMAHELRQPLTIMSFAAQNAARELERNKIEGIGPRLERIIEQSERASTIIEHLRLFARGAEVDARVAPVALDTVVQRALTMIGEALQSDSIEVSYTLDGAVPMALAQLVPLEQVLINLLLNARDALVAHRPPDARRLRIFTNTLTNPARVELGVADNGGGIAPEVLPVLFQPFVTTKLATKAAGLGLSICHGIARSFGGEIAGRNDIEGAVFILTLQAADRDRNA